MLLAAFLCSLSVSYSLMHYLSCPTQMLLLEAISLFHPKAECIQKQVNFLSFYRAHTQKKRKVVLKTTSSNQHCSVTCCLPISSMAQDMSWQVIFDSERSSLCSLIVRKGHGCSAAARSIPETLQRVHFCQDFRSLI